MGKPHVFKSLGQFTIQNGYVFYKRLENDINMMGYQEKIKDAFANRKVFNTTTWEEVSKSLYNTGMAEQKKELEFFQKVFHALNVKEIPYKNYPQYINAINKLIGLKKQYGAQLKELQAQSRDKDNHRAAGAFRYFESRINTALTSNIRKIFGNLTADQIMDLTEEKINTMLDDVIQTSVEEALRMVGEQKDFYQGGENQIWKRVFEALNSLNTITRNDLIETIISRYDLRETAKSISGWLKDALQTKKKSDYKIKGLSTKIKENVYSGMKNSSTEGLLSEFIMPMIASKLKGVGTVIGANKGSDNTAADSVLFFSATGQINVDESILDQFSRLNAENIKDASDKINKLTTEVLDNVEDGFVVYESSKMYRLNGEFNYHGFGGRSGNLINLGEVLKEYGNSNVSKLSANIVNVLYQTMNGAILGGEQEKYIEKTKSMIIETITASLFDDIEFQGVNSKNDQVIHMLDLDSIQIPLSYYCLALSKAIDKAIEDISVENLTNSVLIKKYIKVDITGLPEAIEFTEPEDTKKFGETHGYKYPSSVYEAWKEQKETVDNQGHFKIHFLRNFNNLINSLIEQMKI